MSSVEAKKTNITKKVNLIFTAINWFILVSALAVLPTLVIYSHFVSNNTNVWLYISWLVYAVSAVIVEMCYGLKSQKFLIFALIGLTAIMANYSITRNWYGMLNTAFLYLPLMIYQYKTWNKSLNAPESKLTKDYLIKAVFATLVIILVFGTISALILNIQSNGEYVMSGLDIAYQMGWMFAIFGILLVINRNWQGMLSLIAANIIYIVWSAVNLTTISGFDFVYINWIVLNSFFIIVAIFGIVQWKLKDLIINKLVKVS